MWERVTTGCQTTSDSCLAATTQGGTGREVTVQVGFRRSCEHVEKDFSQGTEQETRGWWKNWRWFFWEFVVFLRVLHFTCDSRKYCLKNSNFQVHLEDVSLGTLLDRMWTAAFEATRDSHLYKIYSIYRWDTKHVSNTRNAHKITDGFIKGTNRNFDIFG